jgi:hypothetical protein
MIKLSVIGYCILRHKSNPQIQAKLCPIYAKVAFCPWTMHTWASVVLFLSERENVSDSECLLWRRLQLRPRTHVSLVFRCTQVQMLCTTLCMRKSRRVSANWAEARWWNFSFARIMCAQDSMLEHKRYCHRLLLLSRLTSSTSQPRRSGPCARVLLGSVAVDQHRCAAGVGRRSSWSLGCKKSNRPSPYLAIW